MSPSRFAHPDYPGLLIAEYLQGPDIGKFETNFLQAPLSGNNDSESGMSVSRILQLPSLEVGTMGKLRVA